jgi:hypothetical protein
MLGDNFLLPYIKLTISKCRINIGICVGFTYAGATVKRVAWSGEQSVPEEASEDANMPWMNYLMDILIVDVCKSVKLTRNIFSFLEILNFSRVLQFRTMSLLQ